MSKEAKYNVKVFVNDGKGETEILKGTVEFDHNPDQYGNGYSMGIRGLGEAFGLQGYDIRYDREFNPANMIGYIVRFYTNRYTGKDGWWKLIGIRVHEADEDE